MNVYFPREITVNNDTTTFSELKPYGEAGAKIVYAKYKDSELNIQCPKMSSPFGLGKYEEGPRVKYSIELSFRGMNENPKVKKLHDFLLKFDEHILEFAAKNSVAWFKKKVSKEVLRELMTPSVKFPKDKETGEVIDKYPPTFKLKVAHYEQGFTKPAFHMETREILTDDWNDLITKGTVVQPIVKHTGIWISGGKFGNMWQIEQVKIQPAERLLKYAFVDDDEDTDDNNKSTEEQDETHSQNTPPKDEEYVLDSEDENEL